MIQNITSLEIKKDKKLQNSFLNAKSKDSNINCNIIKGNFYLDSFNYFLINEEFQSFENLFTRDPNQNIKHFYTKKFFDNFSSNLKNFKEFKSFSFWILISISSSQLNKFSSTVR